MKALHVLKPVPDPRLYDRRVLLAGRSMNPTDSCSGGKSKSETKESRRNLILAHVSRTVGIFTLDHPAA
jgi:hypothetical protein